MKSAIRSRRSNRTRLMRQLEALESRTLMSVTAQVATFPGVSASVGAYDSNGLFWVINEANASLDQLGFDEFNEPEVQQTISLADISPFSVAAGADGHMYVSDFNGGIADVNTGTGDVTPHYFTEAQNDLAFVPTRLTVADGNVWFIAFGSIGSETTVNGEVTRFTNIIGRYDVGADEVDYFTIGDVNDAEALSIAAGAGDSVFVGLNGSDQANDSGSSKIVKASYDSGSGDIQQDNLISVEVGNTADDDAAEANNYLYSVVSDGDGGIWFALGNPGVHDNSTRVEYGADRIVHLSSSLVQTDHLVTADANDPLLVDFVALDGQGNLWFTENLGGQYGYLVVAGSTLNTFDYPAGMNPPGQSLQASPDLAQAIFFTLDPEVDNDPIVIVSVDDVEPPVTFDGSGQVTGTLVENEGQSLTVTFSAPAPAGGVYHALISWGDGSPDSTIDAIPLTDTEFAFALSHTYTRQGSFDIVVTITDSNPAPAGEIHVDDVAITDVPLAVDSFSLVNTSGKFVQATLNFSDDVDASTAWYTVSVNWGDGSSSNGLVIQTSPGHFQVVTVHKYNKNKKLGSGGWQVTATVTSNEGLFEANPANTQVVASGTIVV